MLERLLPLYHWVHKLSYRLHLFSRVILSGEHLRLLDDARQAPASLDGLALVLDDTAHDLNDIIRELFPDREGA